MTSIYIGLSQRSCLFLGIAKMGAEYKATVLLFTPKLCCSIQQPLALCGYVAFQIKKILN